LKHKPTKTFFHSEQQKLLCVYVGCFKSLFWRLLSQIKFILRNASTRKYYESRVLSLTQEQLSQAVTSTPSHLVLLSVETQHKVVPVTNGHKLLYTHYTLQKQLSDLKCLLKGGVSLFPSLINFILHRLHVFSMGKRWYKSGWMRQWYLSFSLYYSIYLQKAAWKYNIPSSLCSGICCCVVCSKSIHVSQVLLPPSSW
jgi:hypothetical protein